MTNFLKSCFWYIKHLIMVFIKLKDNITPIYRVSKKVIRHNFQKIFKIVVNHDLHWYDHNFTKKSHSEVINPSLQQGRLVLSNKIKIKNGPPRRRAPGEPQGARNEQNFQKIALPRRGSEVVKKTFL